MGSSHNIMVVDLLLLDTFKYFSFNHGNICRYNVYLSYDLGYLTPYSSYYQCFFLKCQSSLHSTKGSLAHNSQIHPSLRPIKLHKTAANVNIGLFSPSLPAFAMPFSAAGKLWFSEYF